MAKKTFLHLVSVVLLASCAGKPVSIDSNRPDPCPDSPNCVSSLAGDPEQRVDPLTYSGSRADALKHLTALLETMPRCRIEEVKDSFVHAVFRTRFFGFVDDTAFYFDPERPVIHVRSASRRGYYDFGVNRKRVEAIRSLWRDKYGGP